MPRPTTPLPWSAEFIRVNGHRKGAMDIYQVGAPNQPVAEYMREQDAVYIAHACNSYPELVSALRTLAPQHPLLVKLGEVAP
jgi:hypothetical protein